MKENKKINILQRIKNLFDPKYHKKIAQYRKIVKLKKELAFVIYKLQEIDKKMEKSGMKRSDRRSFWRDFYKNRQVRSEVFNALLKELK